jgi:Pyruvate/2-oxoacid:ferredoxin oxidoreductase delta subunit
MDRFLRGMAAQAGVAVASVGFEQLNLNYFESVPRCEAPILPPEQRKGQEEIEGSLVPNQARQEAERCLSCGNCFACDNCWTLCPDSAVLKTTEQAADGSHYVFDYDYCKGCGLCAKECPCGYITMEDEV